MDLLACEMTARTGKDPGRHYAEIEEKLGRSYYSREDQPATLKEVQTLSKLTPAMIHHKELAGEPIESVVDRASGNNAPIGGLKVTTQNGWFAIRPSGTEPIYKIYAESFKSDDHLAQIFTDAREVVKSAMEPG
jgi:phosphoglucomutase